MNIQGNGKTKRDISPERKRLLRKSTHYNDDFKSVGAQNGCWNRFKSYFQQRPMNAHDTVSLTWWEKWRLYNRFPWKLLTHTLIVAIATALVLLQTQETSPYTVANVSTFYKAFYPPDFDPPYGLASPGDILYLYNIEEVVEIFNNSVQSYYHFPNWSVDIFRFSLDNSTVPPIPPELQVISYKKGGYYVFNPFLPHVDTSTKTDYYNITETDLGPLMRTGDELREFFHSLVKMQLEFTLYSADLINDHPVSHKWRVQMIYDFSQRSGRINVSLRVLQESLPIKNISFVEIFTFVQVALNVCLIFLSCLASILSFTAVKRSFVLYQKTKRNYSRIKTPIIAWNDIPWKLKLRFFNVWFIVSFIADVCLIVGCFFDIVQKFGAGNIIDQFVRFFLGIGTMCSWINLMRYLEFDEKYTVLVNALGRGMPNVARFIVSAAPIFMGYALFGVLYFSEDTIRFATLGEAMVTLFSLQNGDDIQSTFRSVAAHVVVGRIYFFTFIFMSIYCIANIFISIISDAYFYQKESRNVAACGYDHSQNGDNDRASTNNNNNNNNNAAHMNQETDLRMDDSLWEDILAISEELSDNEQEPDDYDEDDIDNDNNNNNEDNSNANKEIKLDIQGKKKIEFKKDDRSSTTASEFFATLQHDIGQLIQEEQQEFQERLQKQINQLIADRLSRGSFKKKKPHK